MRRGEWAALAVVVVLAGLVLGQLARGGNDLEDAAPAPSAAVGRDLPPAASAAQPQLRGAVAVLREWDERRAAAWRRADPTALRALYVEGSSAARADVEQLARWQRSGWQVERLHTQVLGVRLLRAEEGRVVLRVRDRVSGGELVRGGVRRVLPSSAPVTRRLTLVRPRDGSWVVARSRLVSARG